MGPTGVGKTETAKAIASTMFDSEKALVRIDMSEYMDKHSVSRLICAPPGYVGYEEGGQLTETIRRKPYAVILLDEIIVFKPLTSDAIKSIARIQCDALCKRMAKQDIHMTISEQTLEMLATAGYDQTLGARPLKREIQKTIENAIENAIADAMLHGEVIPQQHYTIEPRG